MSDERPDGPLTGLLHDFDQRLAAARRHADAEGHAVDARAVLDSYDRVLHPVMHGRRPHDLVERHGKPAVIVGAGAAFFAVESLGFVAIALAGDAGAWPVVAWFVALAGDAGAWPVVAWFVALAVLSLGAAGALARGEA